MPSARSTTLKEFVAFTRFVILLVYLICHHAIHSRSCLVSCTALHLHWGTYSVLQRVADIHFHLCGRTLNEGFWERLLRIIWSIKNNSGMGKQCQEELCTRLLLLTNSLTPWSRVLLEKLTGFQLVKKFPAFCETRKFITAFTSACHLSLPEPAQSSPYPHIPLPENPA